MPTNDDLQLDMTVLQDATRRISVNFTPISAWSPLRRNSPTYRHPQEWPTLDMEKCATLGEAGLKSLSHGVAGGSVSDSEDEEVLEGSNESMNVALSVRHQRCSLRLALEHELDVATDRQGKRGHRRFKASVSQAVHRMGIKSHS